MTKEAADLVFHLLMLLADVGLGLDDVRAELARREGVSGIDEKAGRLGLGWGAHIPSIVIPFPQS